MRCIALELSWCQMSSLVTSDALGNLHTCPGAFSRSLIFDDSWLISGVLFFWFNVKNIDFWWFLVDSLCFYVYHLAFSCCPIVPVSNHHRTHASECFVSTCQNCARRTQPCFKVHLKSQIWTVSDTRAFVCLDALIYVCWRFHVFLKTFPCVFKEVPFLIWTFPSQFEDAFMCVSWCEALSSRGHISEITGSSSNNGRDPFSPTFLWSNRIQMKNSRHRL